MGYSTSRQTLERMRSSLNVLASGKPCSWQTEPNESHKVAYKIREALYIARLYPDEYPDLARAARDFRISVVSSREVIAERIGNHSLATVKELVFGTDKPSLDLTQQKVELPEAANIVSAWMKKPDGKHYFPQVNLSPEELLKLYNWSQAYDLIFFVAGDGSITLQPRSEDVQEFAWSPEDLEEQ
jgi:hypothetical protein